MCYSVDDSSKLFAAMVRNGNVCGGDLGIDDLKTVSIINTVLHQNGTFTWTVSLNGDAFRVAIGEDGVLIAEYCGELAADMAVISE